MRIPYVISPRGGYNRSVLSGRNRMAKKIWLALQERKYLTGARALHAVSRAEASELEALLPPERIFYVPNGIGREVLDRPVREPAGKNLVFLGRLAIEHKGIDLLLEGYAGFIERTGDRASSLTIAGPDFRGDEKAIRERIQELGLQDRVALPGGVFGDEKWKLIEDAYAFVLTSRWEGMPFALLEALAVGRPSLVTPGTNMTPLVGDFGAGIEVAGDPKQIASGLERLLSLSDAEHAEMRGRARRLIEEHFTWDGVTAQLASRYRQILDRA